MMETNRIYQGDALGVLKTFPDSSIDMVMTSPPYWALRDYDIPGQLGLEPTFTEYIAKLCGIFDEVKRVLKSTGTVWVNIGDTYSSIHVSGDHTSSIIARGTRSAQGMMQRKETGLPDKCLCQIPARFSIAMTDRGWILRNTPIWHKNNCMPYSGNDRFTVDYEPIHFFTKALKYYFEQQFEPSKNPGDDVRRVMRHQEYAKNRQGGNSAFNQVGRDIESVKARMMKGRNKRCVWTIPTKGYREAHFATYPEALCTIPINAGCPAGGIVLDPFAGAGTTCLVAKKLGRQYIGIELNPEYKKMAEDRIQREAGLL